MKCGPDGIWRTVGGVKVSARQQKELDGETSVLSKDDTIHKLWIVHPKTPVHDIVQRECRIVVTDNVTWAEPLMPLRGSARNQKRFMIGAFAFYTRQQAERKKLVLLASLARAAYVGHARQLAGDAQRQIELYKATGVVK